MQLLYKLYLFMLMGFSYVPSAICQPLTYKQRVALLEKTPEVSGYYTIENNGITMYASPAFKRQNKPECKVYFDEIETFKKLARSLTPEKFKEIYRTKKTARFNEVAKSLANQVQKEKPKIPTSYSPKFLQGIRIAIDPGHIGGLNEMAQIEGKFISIRHNDTLYEFNEGNLTLAVALILKDSLTRLGADVFLTRTAYGQTAFGKTYEQWLAQDYLRALNNALKKGMITSKKYSSLLLEKSKSVIFNQFFRDWEMIERTKRINQFNPDLTLILHFNVDEINWNLNQKNKYNYPVSYHNYNMAFVGGGFLPNELDGEDDRIAFLRLLLTDDLDKSILLSDAVMKACKQNLKVEPFVNQQPLTYIQKYSIPTPATGVFARNLILTRFTQGVICYGETLYQDNETELPKLAAKNLTVNRIPINSRLLQVAQSYLEGIINYLNATK